MNQEKKGYINKDMADKDVEKEGDIFKMSFDKMQFALKDSYFRIKSILNNIPDIAWLKDESNRFILVNDAFAKACGKKPESLIGKTDFDIWPEDKAKNIQNDDKEVIKSKVQKRSVSETFLAPKGEKLVVETIKSPIFNDKGKCIGTTGFTRDFTELKKLEKEREQLISDILAAREALHFKDTHDEISGLWDRSAVLDILRKEISRSLRNGSPVSVIISDVINFRKINDQFGNAIGDSILREIGRKLVTMTRPYDTIGRLSGEEFIMILPSCDRENAAKTSERLKQTFVTTPVKTSEGSFPIALAFGVAGIDRASKDITVDEMVQKAYDSLENNRQRH